MGVANHLQLGTKERLREKIEKVKQHVREAAKGTAPQIVSHTDRGEVREALQQRDTEAEVC